MPVPNVPFWLSAVNAEFKGNGWISSCAGPAQLGLPLWCSNFAGRSSWHSTINVGFRQESSTSKFVGYSAFRGVNYGSMSPAALLGRTVHYVRIATVARTESLAVLFSGNPGCSKVTLEFEGVGTYTIPYKQLSDGNAWYTADIYGVYTKFEPLRGQNIRLRAFAA